MLPTVRLDNQTRIEMNEVDDVVADRLLTTKFITEQAMCAKMTPQ